MSAPDSSRLPVVLVIADRRDSHKSLVAELRAHDAGRLAREFHYEYLDSYHAVRNWYQHNRHRFVSLIIQYIDFSGAAGDEKLLDLADVKYPVPRDFDRRRFQGYLIYALTRQDNLDRIAPVIFVATGGDPVKTQRHAGFVVYPGQGSCAFVQGPPAGDDGHGEIIERLDAIALRPMYDERRRHWRQTHQMVIGQSRRMANLASEIERVGPSDSVVLLLGKPGVGKELVANALHRCSHRYLADDRDRVFPHTVNIAALDRNLIEDELFGHERGAFTGAVGERSGIFEAARGSTVFLDEIGDIGTEVQLKLLRTIENRRIKRLGSSTEVPVEMRIVVATNRAVEELQLSFRPDFYSRLVQHCIQVPSLKERWEDEAAGVVEQDLLEMFSFVVDNMNANPRHERKLEIDQSAVRFLHQLVDEYVAGENNLFQGNIRTLRSILEQAYERAQYDGSPAIRIGHIISTVGIVRFMNTQTERRDDVTVEQVVGSLNMKDVERRVIIEALKRCDNNQSKTAETLGLHRDTLRRKIAEYNL